MVLAIDFDDVVHNTRDVKPGYKMGLPMAGAVDALTTLREQGHRIIIHTIWATSEERMTAIADWLKYFKVPYDAITSIKPRADYYIDDHALHFDNWKQTMGVLSA